MILGNIKRLFILYISVFIALILPTYFQITGNFSPITLSASIYAFSLFLVLICCLGRFSLYNPIFLFCFLQLTIYSTSWISSITIVNFSGDTLMGMSSDDTKNAIAKYFLLSTLWLFVATLSYFGSRALTNWRAKDQMVDYKTIGIFIVFISFMSFFLVLEKFDSVFDMLLQRQLTRADRIYAEDGRHLFMVAQAGILGLLFWGLFDNKFYKSYLFLGLFFVTVLVGFIVSGNRTSIVMSFLMAYFCWFYHTGRVFSLKLVFVVFLIFLAISVASDIRSVGFESVASEKKELNISSRIKGLLDLRMERATVGNAKFGVISHIDDNGGPYILGESYYSVLFIPIPSALLDGQKPYAGGRLAAKKLAGRDDTAWPIGHVVEAYWNFGYLGVFLNALIFGFLAKTVRNIVINNPRSVTVVLSYMYFVFFFSLGSDGFYKFFQGFIPIVLIYQLVTRLRLLKIKKDPNG